MLLLTNPSLTELFSFRSVVPGFNKMIMTAMNNPKKQ